jgi:hypothetical protein
VNEALVAIVSGLAAAAVAVLCWRAGRAAGRRMRRGRAEALAAACLLATGGLVVLWGWYPDLLRPLAHSPVVHFEFTNYLPTAAAFFGIAFELVPRPETRRALAGFTFVFGAVGAYHAVLAADAATHPHLSPAPAPAGRHGIFVQTSGWSCGAAAAATLVHFHGIRSSEREMAELCRTYAGRGTSWLRFVRGIEERLRRSRSPLRLEARARVSADAMAAGPFPFLAAVKHGPLFNHAVVVTGRGAEGTWLVGDPITGGVEPYSDEEFRRRFLGEAFWLAP